MLSCKEVSLLLSQSCDARLTLRQRLAVRLHLLICHGCARFAKQLRFLRTAARTLAGSTAGVAPLPAAARERIARTLRQQG